MQKNIFVVFQLVSPLDKRANPKQLPTNSALTANFSCRYPEKTYHNFRPGLKFPSRIRPARLEWGIPACRSCLLLAATTSRLTSRSVWPCRSGVGSSGAITPTQNPLLTFAHVSATGFVFLIIESAEGVKAPPHALRLLRHHCAGIRNTESS